MWSWCVVDAELDRIQKITGSDLVKAAMEVEVKGVLALIVKALEVKGLVVKAVVVKALVVKALVVKTLEVKGLVVKALVVKALVVKALVVKALEVKGLVVKAVVTVTAVTVYTGSTATLRSTDGGRLATRRIRVLHASATPVKDSKKRRAPTSITSPANTAQVATL